MQRSVLLRDPLDVKHGGRFSAKASARGPSMPGKSPARAAAGRSRLGRAESDEMLPTPLPTQPDEPAEVNNAASEEGEADRIVSNTFGSEAALDDESREMDVNDEEQNDPGADWSDGQGEQSDHEYAVDDETPLLANQSQMPKRSATSDPLNWDFECPPHEQALVRLIKGLEQLVEELEGARRPSPSLDACLQAKLADFKTANTRLAELESLPSQCRQQMEGLEASVDPAPETRRGEGPPACQKDRRHGGQNQTLSRPASGAREAGRHGHGRKDQTLPVLSASLPDLNAEVAQFRSLFQQNVAQTQAPTVQFGADVRMLDTLTHELDRRQATSNTLLTNALSEFAQLKRSMATQNESTERIAEEQRRLSTGQGVYTTRITSTDAEQNILRSRVQDLAQGALVDRAATASFRESLQQNTRDIAALRTDSARGNLLPEELAAATAAAAAASSSDAGVENRHRYHNLVAQLDALREGQLDAAAGHTYTYKLRGTPRGL
ncbi:hypothetical protein DFJ77DRAFT_509956 [Powellomyces hirtus]|nr:hypothetical protein DFJ77DRAFT_509956 [Powellomyces hirtus]